ncbi:hypothetical protein JW964_23335 [candidate division KSB1 bacterium]|nr:hypothetical protein [candidate division KSB1 bacterium]
MDTSLDEIMHEMQQLEQQMRKYEWKYSIKWFKFYQLVQSGKIEESFELHEWLGLIKLYLNRKALYQNLLNNLTC